MYCPICGRRYKNQKNLRQHLRYECQKEPQFSCPYCPYKAKLRCNLNKHKNHCFKKFIENKRMYIDQ